MFQSQGRQQDEFRHRHQRLNQPESALSLAALQRRSAAARAADAGVFPLYVEAAVSDHPVRLENQKKAAFPQLARDNAETLEGKAAVVWMKEGWVHEKAMRR